MELSLIVLVSILTLLILYLVYSRQEGFGSKCNGYVVSRVTPSQEKAYILEYKIDGYAPHIIKHDRISCSKISKGTRAMRAFGSKEKGDKAWKRYWKDDGGRINSAGTGEGCTAPSHNEKLFKDLKNCQDFRKYIKKGGHYYENGNIYRCPKGQFIKKGHLGNQGCVDNEHCILDKKGQCHYYGPFSKLEDCYGIKSKKACKNHHFKCKWKNGKCYEDILLNCSDISNRNTCKNTNNCKLINENENGEFDCVTDREYCNETRDCNFRENNICSEIKNQNDCKKNKRCVYENNKCTVNVNKDPVWERG